MARRLVARRAMTVICCLACVALFVAAAVTASAAGIASNERLSFVVYKRGIFSMAGDGTDRRWLVRLARPVGGPYWSPDGKRFLLVSDRHVKRPDRCDHGCSSAMYVANADGSGQRRLTPTSTNISGAPRWSPDGRAIVFGMDNMLSVMRADGEDRRAIPIRGAVDSADWAADGHSIVFRSIDGIVLLDTRAPGKRYRILVDGTEPVLSPDRRFVAYKDASYGISVLDLATGRARKVVRNDQLNYDPIVVWSPDSTELVYVGVLPAKVGQDVALFVTGRDGTHRRQLTPRYSAWQSTAWSQERIFYSAKIGLGRSGIWSMKSDGSVRHRIAPRGGEQLAVQPHPS